MGNLTLGWNWGANAKVAFDPAHDSIDFGWFAGNQLTITQVDGSVVIGIPGNSQTYTLTGVTLAQLAATTIIAGDASAKTAWNDALAKSPVVTPTTHVGETTTIDWHWGTMEMKMFDPSSDKIDLGWFRAGQFTLTEMGDMVMIEIPKNQQMYHFEGVSLKDLSIANFDIKDAKTLEYVQSVLDGHPITIDDDDGGTNTTPTNNNTVKTTENHGGLDYHLNLYAPDIEGFNPAKDRLDLGDYSVHAFVIVQTPDGVAFRTPWNDNDMQVIKGIHLTDLTVDNFVWINNQHLREDVSGALAWAHGIVQQPHTVYALSDSPGRVDRVAFDPATDKVDFRYYASRELVHMDQIDEGVKITNDATHQSLILEGVKLSQLSGEQFLFHFSQVKEDHLDQKLGITFVEKNVISRADIPTAGVASGDAPHEAAHDDLPAIFHLMAGDAIATGGEGNHLFDFAMSNVGHDTITDFKMNGDMLQFSHSAFTDVNDVLAHITQVGADTVVTLNNHDTVKLIGIDMHNIHADDIHIV